MIQINCTVQGKATDIPYLTVDNGHVYQGVFESPSRVIFRLDDGEPPWGYTIWYGGQAQRGVVPAQPGAYEGPVLTYPHALGRLQPDGVQLRVNGKPFVWAMMTGFCDYYLWMTNQRALVRQVWAQARDLGANGRRVFGMMFYITRFDPRAFGDAYFTELRPFAQAAAEYGQRLHFDVFADNQEYQLGPEFFQKVCAQLAPVESVVIGAGNEWPKNGFDPFALPYPGVLSSQGSTTADAAPPMPGWGIRMWHGRRDYPKVFMAFDDGVYVGRGLNESGSPYAPLAPIVHDEPIGFAEIDIPGRRSTDPVLAQCVMLTGRGYGAGATFHSESGIFSRLLGPTEQACARAFFDAQG